MAVVLTGKVKDPNLMTFSDDIQRDVRRRAHGVCECTRDACPHFGRCRSSGGEFHRKKSLATGGSDEASNCLLMCKSCHERVHGTSHPIGRL
jgi:HNH endonuclease